MNKFYKRMKNRIFNAVLALQGKNRKSFGTDAIPSKNARGTHDLWHEFNKLSGDYLMSYIEGAIKGVPFLFYHFANALRKSDLHIDGEIEKRKLSVLGQNYQVDCEDSKVLEYAEEVIRRLGARMYKFFTDCVEANLHGVKLFEINWEYDNGFIYPKEIKPIPNPLYLYDEKKNTYSILDATKIDMEQIRSESLATGLEAANLSKIPQVTMDPVKLLEVESITGDMSNPFLDGINIGLMRAYYYKLYDIKDFNIFKERWASPTKKYTYNSLNDKSKDEAVAAAKAEKTHGTLIVPDDMEVDLLSDSSKGTTSDIYLKSLAYWDKRISTRVLGQSESTEMGNQGSYAALKVKKAVSDDIMLADLLTISFAFSYMMKIGVDMNFANPQDYPEFSFPIVKTLEQKETLSRIYQNLNTIGHKVTSETILDQMDIETEEKETPLPPPADKQQELGVKSEDIRKYLDDLWDSIEEAKTKPRRRKKNGVR